VRPTIGIQRAQQCLEAVDCHGLFGGSQPPDGAAGRQRQAEATAAAAERSAFNLDHTGRQMANMVTACKAALEDLKLLTVRYQPRGRGLQWFFVVSHRIVRVLLHRRSLGL
jgi:hypothetical protein